MATVAASLIVRPQFWSPWSRKKTDGHEKANPDSVARWFPSHVSPRWAGWGRYEDKPIDLLHSEQGIDLLAGIFQFRDYTAVSTFIQQNAFLTGLLFEIHRVIGEYFGPHTQIVLEVFTDPEAGNDQQLFVLIQTELEPEQAIEQLEKFYDGWWLSVLDQAQYKMSVDVEYV